MLRAFDFSISPLALAIAVMIGAVSADVAGAQSAADSAQKAAKSKPAKKTKAEAADPGKQDPAEAQKHLVAGQAALAGGKPDAAVTSLNSALGGRGLNEQDLAKALYLRGAAYRLLQKPALAIADLNGALYIRKGLGEADRRDADEQRAAAYREAGLPDQRLSSAAPTATAPAGVTAPAAKSSPVATVPGAAQSAATAAASPPSTGSSGGIGGFFGSLFGGASASATAQPATTAIAAPAPVPPPSQPAVTSWSTKTQAPGSAPGSVPPPPPSKAGAAMPVVMQLANVRTRAEAELITGRVRDKNAAEIADRRIEVVENIAGSFGTLYAVRLGPFAAVDDSRAVCAKVRAQGLDCLAMPAR